MMGMFDTTSRLYNTFMGATSDKTFLKLSKLPEKTCCRFGLWEFLGLLYAHNGIQLTKAKRKYKKKKKKKEKLRR